MTDLSPASAGWTADRIACLERLWRDGQSASQAARVLGISRNAVIGKVHRLRLSGDGRHAAAQVRPPRPGRPAKPRQPHRVRKARSVVADPPPPEPLTGLTPCLEQLGARACHWPIGDPLAEGFAFCGRPAPAGPYCPAHAVVAHRRGGGRRAA